LHGLLRKKQYKNLTLNNKKLKKEKLNNKPQDYPQGK